MTRLGFEMLLSSNSIQIPVSRLVNFASQSQHVECFLEDISLSINLAFMPTKKLLGVIAKRPTLHILVEKILLFSKIDSRLKFHFCLLLQLLLKL